MSVGGFADISPGLVSRDPLITCHDGTIMSQNASHITLTLGESESWSIGDVFTLKVWQMQCQYISWFDHNNVP